MPTTFPNSTRETLSQSMRKQRAMRGVLNAAVVVVAALALIPFLYLLVRASQKPVNEIVQLLIRPKTLEVLATTSALGLHCLIHLRIVSIFNFPKLSSILISCAKVN